MKTLQNPTTFFFKQAEQITGMPSKQIQDFVNKLINKNQCQLCKQKYDLLIRIPRIMIHCGHTFCTPCLREFYMNRRVRCPMCLKLVKQLDKLERLPINHTIFTHLVEEDKKICEKSKIKPIIVDTQKHLFAEFEKAQKQAHMKEKPQKIDPDSGLPFCVFHPDRVQHFYCAVHSSAGCRVCSEIGHSKPECKVIDLYEIEDPNQLAEMVGKSKVQNHGNSNQNQLDDSSSPEDERGIIIDEETGTRYLKTKNGTMLPFLDGKDDQGEDFQEGYMKNTGLLGEGSYVMDDDDDQDEE